MPLQLHPLPSNNSRTGWAGQTFKHRDAGQAARGDKASAISQSGVRQVDVGLPPSLVVARKLNYKRTEGRQ